MKAFFLCLSICMMTSMHATAQTGNEPFDSFTATSGQKKAINRFVQTLKFVEGGVFTMGGSNKQDEMTKAEELPAHQVTLSSYYIGRYEVTRDLWKVIMGTDPVQKGDNLLPVANISWSDCQDFINKLNRLSEHTFRLPTEAEWEYAATGGRNARTTIYAGSNKIDSVACYGSEKCDSVAQRSANELGLYDMSGNVAEWCQDYYGNYSVLDQTNPCADFGSERVVRGGAFDNSADKCRVTARSHQPENAKSDRIGFRLMMEKDNGNPYKLLLLKKDGSLTEYMVDKRPKMTIKGLYLHVESEGEELLFNYSEVSSIKFEKMPEPTSIDMLTIDNLSSNNLKWNGAILVLSHLPAGLPVQVFSIDGKQIASLETDANGTCRFNTFGLATGVYILKYNNTTCKILKR